MKAFVIFCIAWYAIAAVVNLLSFGVAVGEENRETGVSALIRFFGYLFFLLIAICALAWG